MLKSRPHGTIAQPSTAHPPGMLQPASTSLCLSASCTLTAMGQGLHLSQKGAGQMQRDAAHKQKRFYSWPLGL